MNKNIGAQYYTIRDFCQSIDDFEKSCEKIAEIGYKTVQLSGIGDFSGRDIKKILDKCGLTAVCTHRSPVNYLENIEKEVEFHNEIGCKIAGLGSMPGFNTKKETIASFAENFLPVADKLNENGLTFAYHNHSFEFEKINGRYAFDLLTEALGQDKLKFILDVYWLSYAGINPAKFIREHKGSIACVHFKDLKISDNTPKFAEIGQGNIDWDDVISACEDANVLYALVEQDTCDKNPFESLKISYDFLKEKGFN